MVAEEKSAAAQNFAKTIVFSLVGKVNKISQVFERFSSANKFMVKAGRKNKKRNGKVENNGVKLAWPIKKKSCINSQTAIITKKPPKIIPKGEIR